MAFLSEHSRFVRAIGVFVGLMLVASACGQSPSESSTSGPGPSQVADLDINDWDSVLAAADGTTVQWHMWGGNDNLNKFVDDVYGKRLAELGVTLKRVPADAEVTVSDIISDAESNTDPGTVDVIWMNGKNFGALADQDLLLDNWGRSLPNSQFVDFDNPAINTDFGRDIGELESPWASAQFQFMYDSAKIEEADLPRSYADLATYACENPGRVTYVDPAEFIGVKFLKGMLFEQAGSNDAFSEFDQETWDTASAELWSSLNELESCLWREGKTYPASEAELHKLLANGEVDFSMTLDIAGASPRIADKTVPETTRAFVFDKWMVKDANYVSIPKNAPNKAGAWVLANVLLDPEMQAQQIKPENGGSGFSIDPTKVTDTEALETLEQALADRGEGAVSPEELEKASASESANEYQEPIEKDWREMVLGN